VYEIGGPKLREKHSHGMGWQVVGVRDEVDVSEEEMDNEYGLAAAEACNAAKSIPTPAPSSPSSPVPGALLPLLLRRSNRLLLPNRTKLRLLLPRRLLLSRRPPRRLGMLFLCSDVIAPSSVVTKLSLRKRR
jgi:hypothetical protein